jgi:hypothetical protein
MSIPEGRRPRKAPEDMFGHKSRNVWKSCGLGATPGEEPESRLE